MAQKGDSEGAKNEVSTCDGERGERTIWRRSTAHSFWAKLKGPFLSLIFGPTLSPLQLSIVSPLPSIEEVPSEIMKYCRVSFFSSSIHKRLGLGACVRACTKQASKRGREDGTSCRRDKQEGAQARDEVALPLISPTAQQKPRTPRGMPTQSGIPRRSRVERVTALLASPSRNGTMIGVRGTVCASFEISPCDGDGGGGKRHKFPFDSTINLIRYLFRH